MNKSRIIAALATGAVLCLPAPLAMASSNFIGYDSVVAKVDGDGYTGNQTKNVSRKDAELNSKSVGGNYQVDACLVNAQNGSNWCVGSWTRVNDNHFYPIHNFMHDGWLTRIRFSNDLTTLRDVRVVGTWRAN